MNYSKIKFVKSPVDWHFITKGKVYPFIKGKIKDDRFAEIHISIEESVAINFNDWIPCDENGKELGDE